MRDYHVWHADYDDPNSPLAARLRLVQRRFAELLAVHPTGRIRVLSACAGQGRDVIGVLADHPRRPDVHAVLIELDHRNVESARQAVAAARLSRVDVVEADASISDTYASYVPADVLLMCGIFGNVSDGDVETTVRNLPMLCAPGAAVIWTRHRREPDLNEQIRRWLTVSGFRVLSFDAANTATLSGIGTARLVAPPAAFRPSVSLFTFLR